MRHENPSKICPDHSLSHSYAHSDPLPGIDYESLRASARALALAPAPHALVDERAAERGGGCLETGECPNEHGVGAWGRNRNGAPTIIEDSNIGI